MNTKVTIGASVAVGLMIGALGNQAIHAQGKPKAYSISEFSATEPAGSLADVRKKIEALGGKTLYTRNGTVTAIAGTAPKYVGMVEWPSADVAIKFYKTTEGLPKADTRFVVEAEK
ncbi:MAG: hypothetical protein JO134_19130 [Xanthobacteraceae bacterium]|nr:hypothetical protein [Xanthobacteraceae bacterium]